MTSSQAREPPGSRHRPRTAERPPTPSEGGHVATTQQKRTANRVRRLIRSESRWLQKAVFALDKAEDARKKVVESSVDDASGALMVELAGKKHDVSTIGIELRKAVERRLEERRNELRERMRQR